MFKIFLITIKLLSLTLSMGLKAVDFAVGAKKNAAMPLVIGKLGNACTKLDQLVLQLVKDLEFSQQFKVEQIKIAGTNLNKNTLQDLVKKNVPLGLFINVLAQYEQTIEFEWRLYDILDLKMLVGKTVTCHGDLNQAAHMVANKVWHELMGYTGIFNSVIVACQKVKKANKKQQYIYAFHVTNGTSGKKIIVDTHTINFAPRWHPKKRLLYYSQHTPRNVRLMSVDGYSRKSIVTDFEGLNLTPAISPNGQIVVSLSSSGYEKLYRYDYDAVNKLNKFTALTDSQMHAISPSFIDEDHIVFCAIESVHKLPRIAILDISNHSATFLTGHTFCVSPAYSAAKNKIAYCKKINGVQQIFYYDLNTKTHVQITNTPGDKDECSWSPCGNYLVFTEQLNKESRIALWNMLNKSLIYLSPKGESWSFPTWSPCYDDGLFTKC